jgi:hypothetical protein
VNARFTLQISAMLQVISEQRYDKTHKPHVEWANIAYQATVSRSFNAAAA